MVNSLRFVKDKGLTTVFILLCHLHLLVAAVLASGAEPGVVLTEEVDEVTVEMYSFVRDQAFERRDEQAARLLYDLAGVSSWKEGEWEGALR